MKINSALIGVSHPGGPLICRKCRTVTKPCSAKQHSQRDWNSFVNKNSICVQKRETQNSRGMSLTRISAVEMHTIVNSPSELSEHR